MTAESQRTISLEELALINLFGEQDRHLRTIEARFGVRLVPRNGRLTLSGPAPAVADAERLIAHLIARVRRGAVITDEDLQYAFSVLDQRESCGADAPPPLREAELLLRGDRRPIRPRTYGQARYIESMRCNDIVFAIGPAGTGKTYLAVAMAVRCLREKQVDRIVLARPAVEAGESLGFLPGDLQEKVDPYLRPLYDALREMLSFEKMQRFLELGVVEVVPLAYMRGRTLKRAFAILDEAQNSSLPQMKMFLTRLGPGSRAVVTGDITQVDLSDPQSSGLIRVEPVLRAIRGIEFVHLGDADVLRHRLVRDIINAFGEPSPSRDESQGGAHG
ncbi:MAG: AAA family ATPase [Candidatus Eisenbacteria bacterium]|nr:AAA family ATPase [Candidatus Eisenbacteria bacterium]